MTGSQARGWIDKGLVFLKTGPGSGGAVFLTDTSFLRWPGLRNGYALQGKGPRFRSLT